MQIHLLDISSCDGKNQESVIPELEKIDFQMGSFPVLAKEPVELRSPIPVIRFLSLQEPVRLQWAFPVTVVLRQ